MIRYQLLLAAGLLATAAHAQDYVMPQIPDEATKTWALKRAYQLNGNSMVGYDKMIDVSREQPLATAVKTERIAVDKPVDNSGTTPAQLVQQEAPPNTCTLHHRRKVYSNGGKSWHCR